MLLNVLVIERHRNLADSVADGLQVGGMEVRRVWRFEDVLDALRARPPTVIVTHSTVPSSQGEVNLMPLLDPYPAAIVVISSRGRSEIAGFPKRAVFLAKPFGRKQLLDAISNAQSRS